MNVVLITSSPNTDGLTATCAHAALEGLQAGGAEVKLVNLNKMKVGMCQACNDGWGTCRNEHECQVLDDFQALHKKAYEADALVLVTPVYWHEMSESAKAFTDRIRRCEALRKEESRFYKHPILCIAAAGGTGNGLVSCLASMERWVDHMRAKKFDFFGIHRWNREYKLPAIRAAGEALAKSARSE